MTGSLEGLLNVLNDAMGVEKEWQEVRVMVKCSAPEQEEEEVAPLAEQQRVELGVEHSETG